MWRSNFYGGFHNNFRWIKSILGVSTLFKAHNNIIPWGKETLAARARFRDARTHAQVLAQASEPTFLRGVLGGLELSKRRRVEDKMCVSDASSAFGARSPREPKVFTPKTEPPRL